MALKSSKKAKPKGKLSRKDVRKGERAVKKSKRNEYHSNKNKHKPKPTKGAQSQRWKKFRNVKKVVGKKPPVPVPVVSKTIVSEDPVVDETPVVNKVLSTEELHRKEKREQKKLQKDMSKQRNDQLLRANQKEDQEIRKLEKLLKLNKRKTKGVPKSFAMDGLDYILEVCDPEYMKNAASAEKDLNEGNDNFEEDFALMTGVSKNNKNIESDSDEDLEDFLNEDDASDDDEDEEVSDEEVEKSPPVKNKRKNPKSNSVEEEVEPMKSNKKRKLIQTNLTKSKKQKMEESSDDDDVSGDDDDDVDESNNIDSEEDEDEKKEVWEDIYGRLRTKDGAVLNNTEGKYIPPAIRAKMEAGSSDDKKRTEKLARLRKQLKGFLNRLAESNMHNIANQIEGLYMNNSRNDMNETLTSLINDSLITPVITPERLLMEHVLLITVLHANVGTEVGAHFLQLIIRKFDSLSKSSPSVEDKTLDNVVNVLAQLYNYKVFDAKLLYEILNRLAVNFEEKQVECILHILRSVGFGLRKDDPLALKNLILDLQKQAASASEGKINSSRVKFLLDVLLAIKNNNVTKIPNYDTSYSEHLKKIMKGFIRKGNYVSPLNISLEDLLKADERGKWWVVGSAWTGNIEKTTKSEETPKKSDYSQKLLDLARKQRMNTDTRRDIFCIIMSAEDYMDAFEKLLKLALKNQQEREIIHVILHCCLQEKVFNPYYAVLAQKFCTYDRRFQMTIKCSVWDKLKTLSSHSGAQLSNLAKLLIHLFVEKGLPISVLKIVEFSELDKVTLRLMRQILLGILLHPDPEAIQGVFEKVLQSDKLKMFRESLRLFIHHFLLRNLKTEAIPEEQKILLQERAKMVETILSVKESRIRL